MATINAGRVTFVSKGEYNNATQYYKFDLVNYNGGSYIAKGNTLGNLPTNETYWQLIADKGNTGNVGPTGDTGRGISTIEKLSSSGNVDTYQITYTDGTTSTYEVYNGEVSEQEFQREQERQDKELDYYKTIYNVLPKIKGNGTDITLDNTSDTMLKLGLSGNTEQDGEPTPDNPQDIKVVTGDNEIVISNRNLFDINAFEEQLVTGKILNDRGVEINDTGSTYSTYKVYLKANTTYYFKGAWQRIYHYDANNNWLSREGLHNSGYNSYYTPTVNEYVEFQISNSYWGLNKGYEQIEKNSTATDYVEHQGATNPINLGNIELCKIGDYKDYIYEDNSKWYLHKEIGKIILDGSESWTSDGSLDNVYRFALPTTLSNLDRTPGGLSKYFKYLVGYAVNSEHFYFTANGGIYIFISKEIVSNLTTFKEWLSTHNTDVYYPLATPINEEITDTTLITQLNNIKYALAYKDQTNILQINNDLPFIIDAETLRDMGGEE